MPFDRLRVKFENGAGIIFQLEEKIIDLKKDEQLEKKINGAFSYSNDFIDSFLFEGKIVMINGSFEGSISEEEFTDVTNEKVYIKGFIDGDHISFVKSYPFSYYLSEDETEIVFDPYKKGHDVIYDGYLNTQSNEFEGNWEIKIKEEKLYHGKYEINLEVGFFKLEINDCI